jgi:NAD(P)-dependent dehydrogenase (short-subunit alcohol dehydrogenase family)
MTDNQLKGRVALVTGAGDGLGQGIARRFAQAGAAVLIAEFDDVKGQATADNIVADGGQAGFVHCDITDKTQTDAAIQTAVDDFGSIDILVDNAYRGCGIHRVEDKTDEEYEANFAMNVLAPNWAMKRAFPVRKRNSGDASSTSAP